MLQKIKEHKWTIITVVLVAAAIYYFYQKSQDTSAPLLG